MNTQERINKSREEALRLLRDDNDNSLSSASPSETSDNNNNNNNTNNNNNNNCKRNVFPTNASLEPKQRPRTYACMHLQRTVLFCTPPRPAPFGTSRRSAAATVALSDLCCASAPKCMLSAFACGAGSRSTVREAQMHQQRRSDSQDILRDSMSHNVWC